MPAGRLNDYNDEQSAVTENQFGWCTVSGNGKNFSKCVDTFVVSIH